MTADFERILQETAALWQADRDYWFLTVYTRYRAPVLAELTYDLERLSAEPWQYAPPDRMPIVSRPSEPVGALALRVLADFQRGDVRLCRHTLMPSHIHMLVSCRRGAPEPVSWVRGCKAAVTRARNLHFGIRARHSFFEAGHLAHPVANDWEMREILTYMEENPARYYYGRRG